MESAKMGKCGCGPFKIHKKKVFALLRVITKVFLPFDTNASKMGRNFVSSAERKSCKCLLKCQLNRVSPVQQKKKNWKAMTQHQSLLRELAHQIWVRVFFGLLNRLHMLCHCFSELWSFFPFSSETLDWHWIGAVAQLVECRTRNRESPGLNPRCYRFEVWAFSFTSRCLSRLSCINEYLAIDSGGNVSE